MIRRDFVGLAALQLMKKTKKPTDKVLFTVQSLREVRLAEVRGGGSPPVKLAFAPPVKTA